VASYFCFQQYISSGFETQQKSWLTEIIKPVSRNTEPTPSDKTPLKPSPPLLIGYRFSCKKELRLASKNCDANPVFVKVI
jgi:hypothetical protein